VWTLPAAAALTVVGASAGASGLGPGGKIGPMRLAVGRSYQADLKLFDSCNPVILKPGRYTRSCRIPRVRRLFVGYGTFERTKTALVKEWKRTRWSLWVDSHAVTLPPFGTSDRSLYSFPAAHGKSVVLREWNVVLVGTTPGVHRVRYLSRSGRQATDATWTFVVAKS
jgi:hypothetical protein